MKRKKKFYTENTFTSIFKDEYTFFTFGLTSHACIPDEFMPLSNQANWI